MLKYVNCCNFADTSGTLYEQVFCTLPTHDLHLSYNWRTYASRTLMEAWKYTHACFSGQYAVKFLPGMLAKRNSHCMFYFWKLC